MKTVFALINALFCFQSSALIQAAPPRNFHCQSSFCPSAQWKRIRVVELVTGTDNGGELEVFRSGSARKIRVLIGLSNATVETDFIFEREKLARVETTRTSFAPGENGFDFNKPIAWQNGRYRFKNGREIGRVTREKTANGRWKTGVALMDAMSATRILEKARFFLKMTASSQSEVDIEDWIKNSA